MNSWLVVVVVASIFMFFLVLGCFEEKEQKVYEQTFSKDFNSLNECKVEVRELIFDFCESDKIDLTTCTQLFNQSRFKWIMPNTCEFTLITGVE